MTAEIPEKKKFTFPTAYTILALLLVVVALLTFVIPAGKYDTNPTDGAPIPGTYHLVEASPQRLRDVFLAPINGMYGVEDFKGNVNVYNVGGLYGAIDVALFILMIGGFLGVTMKTGAIDAGIAAVVKRLGAKGKLLIPILMIIFAAGGTSYGMAEESLAFYPLIIAALIALGYDALTAVAVIMLGAGIGVLGSTINPFATGIASGFAGITIADGLILRIIILVVGTALGIWYVMRYANRVKNDPSKSRVADMQEANKQHFLRSGAQTESPEFTTRRKVILGLFGASFLFMMIGVIPWADVGVNIFRTRYWWFAELAALFMVMAIVIGIVNSHARAGSGQCLHRWRARYGGRGAGRRVGARYLGDHDQRDDHRHGAALVRTGAGPARAGGVHQCDLSAVSAAVVSHSVVVRLGDGDDAHHGAAGEFCRCARQPRGYRISIGLGLAQSVHAHVRRGRRGVDDRARAIFDVVEVRAAAGDHPGCDDHSRVVARHDHRHSLICHARVFLSGIQIRCII